MNKFSIILLSILFTSWMFSQAQASFSYQVYPDEGQSIKDCKKKVNQKLNKTICVKEIKAYTKSLQNLKAHQKKLKALGQTFPKPKDPRCDRKKKGKKKGKQFRKDCRDFLKNQAKHYKSVAKMSKQETKQEKETLKLKKKVLECRNGHFENCLNHDK